MSEMSITNVSNYGMNEAGVYNESLSPGRCPVVRTRGPGRHQATVRKNWSTQDTICVMTCYYQNQLGVRGYRQRLHAFWKGKGFFSSRRAKVLRSSANDSKERLVVTPVIRGDKET